MREGVGAIVAGMLPRGLGDGGYHQYTFSHRSHRPRTFQKKGIPRKGWSEKDGGRGKSVLAQARNRSIAFRLEPDVR